MTELDSGSFVGEICLVTDMPRTATVTALEQSTCLRLHKDHFNNMLQLMPDIRADIDRMARHRSAQSLQALKVRFSVAALPLFF